MLQQDHIDFLDRTQEGGTINMLGATPLIQEHFTLEYNEAKTILKEWMDYCQRQPTTTVSLGDILDKIIKEEKS